MQRLGTLQLLPLFILFFMINNYSPYKIMSNTLMFILILEIFFN
jgi:hypothetical protein